MAPPTNGSKKQPLRDRQGKSAIEIGKACAAGKIDGAAKLESRQEISRGPDIEARCQEWTIEISGTLFNGADAGGKYAEARFELTARA
jgi:hypothetical protein